MRAPSRAHPTEPDSRHAFDVIIARMRGLAVLIVIAGLASPAWAQDPPPAPAPAIDATKLGVDLGRIQKGLRVAESNEKVTADGLRLEFFNPGLRPVPEDRSPQGRRSVQRRRSRHRAESQPDDRVLDAADLSHPGLPISALAFWAAQHFWEKSKKSRCEEEIANYRALVMQGVNVAAPRCTQ